MFASIRRKSAWLAGLMALSAVAGLAQAQTFPNKPIRVIIGFPAGTPIDITGRLLAPYMQQDLGQPLIVEQRVGAGGFLGLNTVMTAAPDGYTIAYGWPQALLPSLVKVNPVDAGKDMAPISNAWSGPYIFATSATLPVHTFKDLLAYAKTKPAGSLNFASTVVQFDIMMVALKSQSGLSYTTINYPGGSQMYAAIVSGESSMFITNYGPISGFVDAGKIRMLFQTGNQKLAQLPDLPTAAEAGASALQGITTDVGFWGPHTAPQAIRERLQHAVAFAVKTPDIVEQFRKQGISPVGSTPEEQLRVYEATAKFWADAAHAANYVPQ